VSDSREIVCRRVVSVDSEFNAKKGQGERPGPPVCICAVEVTRDGREIEHRLAAPYPRRRLGNVAIRSSHSASRCQLKREAF
jgi:hypothetical protein